MRILLTGATGYVGRNLLPRLEEAGHEVRCLARRPGKLAGRTGPRTEVLGGDASDPDVLARACAGIDVAYWLVHSMDSGVDFERADRLAAERFVAAARAAGVRRVVYLGGLGADDDSLSDHLRSRHEVGAILRASGLDVVEFRASIVIGPGSFSFDMVRTLVERLPVMVCPRWVATPTQPIAVADVVSYLLAALDLEGGGQRVYEIGGPEVESYGSIMREYARQRGLRRVMLPVPLLTPRLSGLWLDLVAPGYAKVGRKLIDGLRNPTVVTDRRALDEIPVRPRALRTAVAEAMAAEDAEFAGKRWADLADREETHRWGGSLEGTRLVDHRHAAVRTTPERAFAAIERIGGRNGWYACDWLWTTRGWIDSALGGPGMERRRADPDRLRSGEAFDCWRVEACDRPRRLRLEAEMKLPGRGWLEFEVVPRADGVTIHQTAVFDARGLAGLAYWYSIWPLHEIVFRRMLAGIARRALTAPAPPATTPAGSGA